VPLPAIVNCLILRASAVCAESQVGQACPLANSRCFLWLAKPSRQAPETSMATMRQTFDAPGAAVVVATAIRRHS